MTISHFTMFAVHLLALWGCVRLYKAAPCWMQKLFMAMLASAMLIISIFYVLALFDDEYRVIVRLASAIEHIGVLIYIFRLNVQGFQWTPSSERSPSSPA